jgi:hypothetical protein
MIIGVTPPAFTAWIVPPLKLLRHQQDIGVLARQRFGECGRLVVDVRQPVELICRLVGLLPPSDRLAFRRPAEEVLARAPCWSEGAIHRAVIAAQRTFFNSPAFDRVE